MSKTIKKSGFTLIELLIVIGLLAALAAVLLPTLMGDREDALSGIDKYNAAGTLRTLRQYQAITGNLPNGMHTGLDENGVLMAGVTDAFSTNASKSGSITTLSADDVTALQSIGITKLAYGTGDATKTGDDALGYKTLTEGSSVISVTSEWVGEDDEQLTFNGKGLTYLLDPNGPGFTKIIDLFLTPTADWSSESTGWVKGFNIKMDVPGTCPLVDDEFSYYTVFIGIKANGEATVSATASDVSGNAPTKAPLPDSTTAADIATLKTAVAGLTDAGEALNGGTTPSWTDTKDSNGDIISSTANITLSSGGNAGTYSYTITYNPKGTAEFLGTSCPEHGITNP
ncbi:MAG: prepilin-type N-terminal cleavage/methylation domain-containing protein [Planctomycetaceae bacterium]|jgi:prepilin-type N-terminal cleavage/methylation domain-containing protein|nr:prepilin-type N-terminal cleavage/methylation domain-containing protein [Planctomycetaceae bacterium]